MNPRYKIPTILIFSITIAIMAATAAASTDPFPVPEVIKPNVAFWTKVYAEYTTRQGIVHDNRNLDIIYDVIKLVPYDQPGATRINRKRMKKANKKYERILWRLAKNPNNTSSACRKVATLFPEPHTSRLFSEAARRVRCQIGQKDRFRAGLVRSGAYIDRIRAILVANNIPEDLAYLPHVESSFNPKAYSKFGAAGIWQFTRSTGKRFMTVGYTMDERRDPILATHAAAELLKENYEKLGCWSLAITAYNHGATGMQRAKEQHGEYASIFQHYKGRTFKFASRNFYSEFIAARAVAKHYEDYFGPLELDQPPKTQTVVLKGYAPFADLSRHFSVTPDLLKTLNPALRDPVITGQKHVPRGYPLRLPAWTDGDESITVAAVPDAIYRNTQKASRFYTVQRGDTAGKIARMHRVRLSDLILANNLNRRATIYPRQTLRIPTKERRVKEPTPAPVETTAPIAVAKAEPVPAPAPVTAVPPSSPRPEQISMVGPAVKTAEPEAESEPATVIEKPLMVAANDASKTQDVAGAVDAGTVDDRQGEEAAEVQSDSDAVAYDETDGDTMQAAADGIEAEERSADESRGLIDIPRTEIAAVEKDISAAEIAVDEVKTGIDDEKEPFPQPVLASVIPLGPLEAALDKEDPADLLAHNEQIVAMDIDFLTVDQHNGRSVGVIQVEVEETLGHYAEWARIRTQQIRNLNRLKFGKVLNLHQKIKIPLHHTDADTFKQNRYEFHKRLQEDFFAVYRIGELEPYRVRRGDNFWTICREKFEIPMWLLKHCNPEIDLADLRMHQLINIPTIEKRVDENTVPDISAEPDLDHLFQALVRLEPY